MTQVKNNEIEILLVEDNPADVRLTIEALKEAKMANRLNVVDDGVKAMDSLHRRRDYTTAPQPNLVLLDLNLPGKDGWEVLKEIKSDPDLRRIPVVILTTSEAEEDVLRAYDMNCNCYISKPLGLCAFMTAVKSTRASDLPS